MRVREFDIRARFPGHELAKVTELGDVGRIVTEVKNKIRCFNPRFAVQRQRADDHGFQFTKIAKPQVVAQTAACLGGKSRFA